MPLAKNSDFSPNMICLETLDSWTVLDVLNQVREAGYNGSPFRPILFYRIALRKEMEKHKAKGDEKMNVKYLAAEKALHASAYDRRLLSFVLGNIDQGKSTSTSSEPPPPPTTSNPPDRKKIRTSTPRPKNKSTSTSISTYKSTGGYKPAPYRPAKKSIVKGFISKEPSTELPLWEQPYLLGPAVNDVFSATNKREREEEEEVMPGNERRLKKVVKRAGWLF